MLRSSRSRNFFRKIVVNGVNNGSKAAVQNDCLMRLYDADAELKAISNELDSFDGKKDPIRCNFLVNQLRTAQDKVISLLFQLMDECNCERASRDYRMKFPDEILLSEGSESLNGQIWFGAECLSAGSNILNHTKESTMLRPMAKTLTQHLDSLRNDLRDLVIDGSGASHINQPLIKKMVAFDHIFATFEYEYVRTMLPIRTVAEIEKLQEVAVLFSETLIDCVKRGLIKQDDIDEFQPIVMIAIPRLAIVRGLLYKNENPIYNRHKSQMCSIFQPFHGPLHSIRKLLRGLSSQELLALERMLADDQSELISNTKRGNSSKSPSAGSLSSQQLQRQQTESTQTGTSSFDTEDNNVAHLRQQSSNAAEDDEGDDNGAGTSNNFPNLLMNGLQYPVGQKRDSSDETASSNTMMDEQQHRSHISSQSLNDLDQQNCVECCAFDVPSSSKAHTVTGQDLQPSPIGSAPSTSSSISPRSYRCKKPGASRRSCRGCAPIVGAGGQNRVDDDYAKSSGDNDQCCLSPPESDAQLEKLIANFDSSMATQEVYENTAATQSENSPESSNSGQVNVADESRRKNESETTTTCDENNSKQQQQQLKTTTSANEEELLEKLFMKQAQQLLHRLFVAISGVADQLQSNFASDLRFILRHIFSSELEDAEDEADVGEDYDATAEMDNSNPEDYSNNEHSDSSLPIEQAIEAQEDEVSNLIDLDSGYSPNDNPREQEDPRNHYCPYLRAATTASVEDVNLTSSTPGSVMTTAQAAIYEDEGLRRQQQGFVTESDFERQPMEQDRESPIFRSSSSTLPSRHHHHHHHHHEGRSKRDGRATDADDRRLVFRDTYVERPQHQVVSNNEESVTDYIRATSNQSNASPTMHQSTESPSDPSIIDNNNPNRQQLFQQHLQNISRHSRTSSRSNGRPSQQQYQAHRHDPTRQPNQQSSGMIPDMPERVGRYAAHESSQPRQQQHQQLASHPYIQHDQQQPAHPPRRSSRHHASGSSRSRRIRGPPVWVPDELVVACNCCNAAFTLFRRRHHCRACGQIFCADCSKFTKDLNCWGYNGPVRVCQSCYQQQI